MSYDNNMRGVLFKNSEKKSEKSPDYLGKIEIDNVESAASPAYDELFDVDLDALDSVSDPWDALGWREAAFEYRRDRGTRANIVYADGGLARIGARPADEYEGLSSTFAAACRAADNRQRRRLPSPRLERLRRLMDDDVSLDRAWRELDGCRARDAAPEATIEALMFALRRCVRALATR